MAPRAAVAAEAAAAAAKMQQQSAAVVAAAVAAAAKQQQPGVPRKTRAVKMASGASARVPPCLACLAVRRCSLRATTCQKKTLMRRCGLQPGRMLQAGANAA